MRGATEALAFSRTSQTSWPPSAAQTSRLGRAQMGTALLLLLTHGLGWLIQNNFMKQV